MIARLRTLAFAIGFYGGSVPIVLFSPLAALVGQRAMIAYVRGWCLYHRWCVTMLLGIRVRVEGAPLQHPALYAAKHEALFDPLELLLQLGAPAIVMRQEFARIPVFGWSARRYGIIVIDRAGAATALRQILREARGAVAQGRSVLIFPEGTRTPVGDAPPLKSGFAGLYRMLALDTVPIALDSGRLWPKRGLKRAGTITLRFGEPLPPGMKRDAIEAAVHREINSI